MKISINWIKDYVDLTGINIEDLLNRFTISCAEIEQIEYKGSNTSGILVAKVLEVMPHPNSEKLHLVKLDAGTYEITVVCGAPNVKKDMLIAFAPVGACVNGHKMEKATIRGVESLGMCCGGDELGISDDKSGLIELFDVKPGEDFIKVSGLLDIVFEIDNKSLTNRPDLWCHYGIAREISALTGRPLKKLELIDLNIFNTQPKLNVVVESDDCFRYSAIEVENIRKNVSPIWMQTRLFYAGMRAINLVTDLTNYVMLETGAPMHAFDKSCMQKIEIKNISDSISFTTLDGVERNLPAGSLMISNSTGPVAIAGIMGGQNSETSLTTNGIILESANFNGISVRKLSSELSLRTESSIRYEKMLDPNICDKAPARFIKLLQDIDDNIKVVSSYTDIYNKKLKPNTLEISEEMIVNYIGFKLETDKIISILTSLEFKVEYNNGIFKVEVPTFRSTKDITIPVDLIEEITRIYGYSNITPKSNKFELKPVIQNAAVELEHKVKKYLSISENYNEIHTYIWSPTKFNASAGINCQDFVKTLNSIDPELSSIRSSLHPSLLALIHSNHISDAKIYEIARVVAGLDNNNMVIEKKRLSMIVSGKDNDVLNNLIFSIKNMFKQLKNIDITMQNTFEIQHFHPKATAKIFANSVEIGYVGLLHPSVQNYISKKQVFAVAELYFDEIVGLPDKKIVYKEVSKYQDVNIDLNFVAPVNFKFENIERAINNVKTNFSVTYKLIDIYKNKEVLGDNVSYTITFNIVSNEKTLSSEEISEFTNAVISENNKIGVFLR